MFETLFFSQTHYTAEYGLEPLASASPRVLGLQACVSSISHFLQCRGLNPGLHPRWAGTLPTEPYPQASLKSNKAATEPQRPFLPYSQQCSRPKSHNIKDSATHGSTHLQFQHSEGRDKLEVSLLCTTRFRTAGATWGNPVSNKQGNKGTKTVKLFFL